MTITINGSGTITGATTMASATSFSADVTLAGSGVEILNNSGNRVLGQSGSVLQIVSATKTDVFSMASGTWADVTGLSVSITPTSTSSKILVMINMNWSTSTYTNGSGYRIVRNSTALCIGDAAGSRTQVTGGWEDNANGPQYTMFSAAMNYVDSPASTSATTYKVQIVQTEVLGTTYVNSTGFDGNTAAYPRGASTITVMEIAQ